MRWKKRLQWMTAAMSFQPRQRRCAGATAYLRLAGDVVGGHYLDPRRAQAERCSQDSEAAVRWRLPSFFAEDTLCPRAGFGSRAQRRRPKALREGGELLWSI
jgi:hypothetical protein